MHYTLLTIMTTHAFGVATEIENTLQEAKDAMKSVVKENYSQVNGFVIVGSDRSVRHFDKHGNPLEVT